MSDVYDRATEIEEQHREDSIAAQRARSGLADPRDWERLSAKWCKGAGCGERIPDERRRLIPGVDFCVRCQAMREEQERRGR